MILLVSIICKIFKNFIVTIFVTVFLGLFKGSCRIMLCSPSGSWTFPQKELDLMNSTNSGVIDYYVENDAWELQGVGVYRSVNLYPG